MNHIRRIALCLALVSVVALVCGCGQSSPTETPGSPASQAVPVKTSHGTATAYTDGRPFDPAAAGSWFDAGFDKAHDQVGARVDNVRVDNVSMTVRPPGYSVGGIEVYGAYHPGTGQMDVVQGYENVVRHEAQHWLCEVLGNGVGSDCCRCQDHATGSRGCEVAGYNLMCQPLPKNKAMEDGSYLKCPVPLQ